MCQVFAGGLSANATAELGRLGFSAQQIIVLILCITASAFALLLCIIIYRRTQSTGLEFETGVCGLLYSLRPLMLINIAPYLPKMSEFYFLNEFAPLTLMYFTVLFKHIFGNLYHYTQSDRAAIMFVAVAVLLLFSMDIFVLVSKKKESCGIDFQCPKLCRAPQRSSPVSTEEGAIANSNLGRDGPEEIHSASSDTPPTALCEEICKWFWVKFKVVAEFSFLILPSLQFTLVLVAFGGASGGFFVSLIFPVFFFLSFSCLAGVERTKNWFVLLSKTSWIIFMILITAVMVYFYIATLKNEKDGAAWISMAVFQQVLWMITMYFEENEDLDLLFRKILYAFGSVVVVLLNAVALMTKVILKTVDAKHAVWDLRVVVFTSESLFVFSLLIFLMFGPWISDMKCLQYCQKAARSGEQNQSSQNAAGCDETPATESNQNQMTAESHELEILLTGRSDVTEETQPNSEESQTCSTIRENC
ncbi:uncharacterized protein [Garra rufa]|uniref:uncharacterized protein isoform X2 n=1 Tax=Garra rufa TaxID=137080 RepID=UPI003CCE8A43